MEHKPKTHAMMAARRFPLATRGATQPKGTRVRQATAQEIQEAILQYTAGLGLSPAAIPAPRPAASGAQSVPLPTSSAG